MICLEANSIAMKVNLCNICAPNIEDANFFHKINKSVGDFLQELLQQI